MIKKAFISSFILSLCLLCLGESFAQDMNQVVVSPEKEAEFKTALSYYLSQNYRSAFNGFESLTNETILHQRMTGALLMAGKSLYQLGKYSFAIPYFNKLIKKFPQSHYVDDSYFARAAAEYQMHQYLPAVKDWLWIVDRSPAKALQNKSRFFAQQIMRKELLVADLQKLNNSVNDEIPSAIVAMELAQKYVLSGEPGEAITLLSSYKRTYGSNAYSPKIDKLIAHAKGEAKQNFKIGVVLPLTGLYGDVGVKILRGIKFAQKKSQEESGKDIDVVVRDSESDMVKAIHATQNLMSVERVRAMIGDLESSVTAGIGALAATKDVTLIGPAATENGVSSVGETVFQLNSDLEQKGRALADYAFHVLGLRTFATLSPADDYGQQITSSFTTRIDELGGRIISQQWYLGDTDEGLDLTRQFKNIREAAFSYDSTDVEALMTEAKAKGENLKERDIPVLSIDGFFVPIYSEDLPYVAPQFALFNIRTQLLGGEYWDDLEQLTKPQIQKYINSVVFVSDFYPDEQSAAFRKFRTEFRMDTKTNPERWEVFGYDAFNLITTSVHDGARSGYEISRKLSALSKYHGMKGLITFKGNNRVNKEVNFLQFINGKIVKHLM